MEIVIRRALEKRKLHFEIERLREELANVPGHELGARGQPGDDARSCTSSSARRRPTPPC